MLELSVTDNGPGIPQDVQTKIFDPFFTTKPPGKGTGLGLSVIRRLVQDVGGNIQVESLYGHGCCMRLRFPHDLSIQIPNTHDLDKSAVCGYDFPVPEHLNPNTQETQ